MIFRMLSTEWHTEQQKWPYKSTTTNLVNIISFILMTNICLGSHRKITKMDAIDDIVHTLARSLAHTCHSTSMVHAIHPAYAVEMVEETRLSSHSTLSSRVAK